MQMRTCLTCQVDKEINQFGTIKGTNGLFTYYRRQCKICEAARKSSWHSRNKEKFREKRTASVKRWRASKLAQNEKAYRAKEAEKARKWAQNTRSMVYIGLGGAFCACCGISEPTFLSIDHIKNDGYKRRKAGIEGSGARLIQVVYRLFRENGKWPTDEFQVLCMNCQHGKSRNGGICPHKQGVTIIPEGSRAKRLEAHHTPQG